MADELREIPRMQPPEDLTGFLSGLKSSGCTLLVTGNIDPEARAAVSRRLFGAPESKLQTAEPRRKRILVQTDCDLSPHQYHPSGMSETSGKWSVLDATEADRSSAAMDTSPDGRDPFNRSDDAVLAEISNAVEQSVDDLLEGVADPDPAELRIGCTSLRPLEKRFRSDSVVAFANSLTSITRRNRGMCHLHYPKADAAQGIRRLSSVVNARLEVATVGSSIYVTWHTPYENVDGAETPINWFDMVDD